MLTDPDEDRRPLSRVNELSFDGDIILPDEKDLYNKMKHQVLTRQFTTAGGLKLGGIKAYKIDG